MMFNLLKGITKPFGGQSTQQNSTQAERPGDRLEDGFLLVGQSVSERTTVTASGFQNRTDRPPGYNDVMNDGLPNYSAYTSCVNQYSPTLDVSQHPGLKYGNPSQQGCTSTSSGAYDAAQSMNILPTEDGQCERLSVKTAVSDIPFVLGPSVSSCQLLAELQNSNVLYQQTFDSSLYDYDFNVELNFLHGSYETSMEVAD